MPYRIEDIFNVSGNEGAAWLFAGSASNEHMGGGFLYTNETSISLGVVFGLHNSHVSDMSVPAMLENFKNHPVVKPLIKNGKTMMMSIYERTKEIGIMKVLGCDMAKIRDMFLIESALIGLIGGVVGVGASYFVAFILNSTNVGYVLTQSNGNIAIIPSWLGFLAVIFAIIVGMVAGLLPSLRAMKLSPLSTLRNE